MFQNRSPRLLWLAAWLAAWLTALAGWLGWLGLLAGWLASKALWASWLGWMGFGATLPPDPTSLIGSTLHDRFYLIDFV